MLLTRVKDWPLYKTVETLQADLAGKLYKQFDSHDPEGKIPTQLTKLLEDYGIVVLKHP